MSTTQDYPQNVPSAKQGEAVSVAAPGLVGVGGTLQDFRDQLLNQRESLSLIPGMEEKVLAIDCALHELELYVGKPRISVLEQFQRWLENKAHSSADWVRSMAPLRVFAEDVFIDEELLIAECRVATKLLMQFKLEQGA